MSLKELLENREVFTSKEVRELLHISKPTLSRLINKGILDAYKLSPRKTFITKRSCYEYIASAKVKKRP